MAARLLNQPAQAQCDAYTPLGESIPGACSAASYWISHGDAACGFPLHDRASLRTRSRACLESSEARPSLHDVGWAAALTMWAATGHHGACRTVAIGMFMGCSALDRCDVCVRCAGLLVTRPRIARVRATTALMSCLAMVLHVQSTVKAQSTVEALQRHSGGGRLART